MSTRLRIQRSLAALHVQPRPARLMAELREHGSAWADDALANLDPTTATAIEGRAQELDERGIDVVLLGDDHYPEALATMRRPPPVLYTLGNMDLFRKPGIGMCGSRNVSDVGLEAARTCGDAVAALNLTVVSGYAKGVDTETHLSALRSGGRTVIVLAEGILHFRKKRVFKDLLDFDRVLVVSQFPPAQRWNVGAAMTRNAIIAALGHAMVVVEASEKGGTLNAGLQALDMGRPVITLEFSTQDTPAGNRLLIDKGALPIRNQKELSDILARLLEGGVSASGTGKQLPLL